MAMEKGALSLRTQDGFQPDPQWGGDLLDLDAYLRRVGYDGPRTATLGTLFALHQAHKDTIAFENLDVALGRGVSLDLSDVQRKLVEAGRGGYCFEHNLLFAAVLEHFGFPVTRLLARVRQGRRQIRYRAHTTLVVAVDFGLWVVDPGFGAEGLIEPIPLDAGALSKVGAWSWRVMREEDQWVLQTLREDGWFDLYSFRVERHFQVDFEVSNYYTAHHSRSTFTEKLIAMRGTGDVQQTLTNDVLTTRYGDGRTECAALSGDDVVDLLRGTFSIRLTDHDARLLRQLPSRTLPPLQEA